MRQNFGMKWQCKEWNANHAGTERGDTERIERAERIGTESHPKPRLEDPKSRRCDPKPRLGDTKPMLGEGLETPRLGLGTPSLGLEKA